MNKQKTLILVDGHALAFKQYFALERTNMKTSDGTPSWAVYGFFKAIFDLLKNKKIQPDAICVAFDVSHQTFRVEKFEQYKANREAMPDALQVQMGLIYEGLKAFNIPVYTKEGFEADDVIGTISKQACELGHKVLILTGDQDAFQLIDEQGCVKVIISSKGELKEYDWNAVYAKLSVYPNQIIDYKSLRGDSSDNIPGVKGIGEKTAVKLLERYGNLQNIIEHCEEIQEKKARECLCADLEMAKTSYFLATIVRNVDIDFDFAGTRIELPDVAEVTNFLRKMQFYSFLKNIDSILTIFNKNDVKITIPASESNNVVPQQGAQLGLFSEAVKAEVNKKDINFESKAITNFQDLTELVQVLKTKPFIAIRTEAVVKNAVDAKLFGLTIAYNDNFTASDTVNFVDNGNITKSFYIPTDHYIDNQLSEEEILTALKPILEDKNIKKLMHDAKTEMNILLSKNVNIKGIIFDTMLASYIKDTTRNHSLDIQSLENIDHIISNLVPLTKDVKASSSIVDLSVESILDFTGDVISSIFELTKYWILNLDEKEKKFLYNIEVPLATVLSEMEFNGVAIDEKYLSELSNYMTDELKNLEVKIYEIAGETFNVGSPKQVAEILFDKLQLKARKKRGKTKYSTGAAVLEELAQDYEIAELILQHRKFAKLKSTYTDALPNLISPVDNRIHTSYNQTTTATGRLSSSNPNLQNIPIRTEEGNKIRKAFVPQNKEKSVIMSADYSQIELRLLAHVSGDEHLIEAFKSGLDVHSVTASKIFEVPVEEVTRNMRYKAKAVNFGIVYGQTKYGLAKAIDIPVADAEKFINKYFETYPKVKQYMEDRIKDVEENGYVETIFGRKRYLADEFNSPNGNIKEFAKRAAINQPMQGSASDLIKIAMVDLDKKMAEAKLNSKLIIQVHDELVLEVDKDELETVKKLVIDCMELKQPLSVPLIIDVNVGETWQEI